MIKEEEIKDQLIASDPAFRRLAAEHDRCEGKLHEMSGRRHLTERDQLQEVELKKKKLHLKDQMNSMIQNARRVREHQHS